MLIEFPWEKKKGNALVFCKLDHCLVVNLKAVRLFLDLKKLPALDKEQC